MNLLYLKFIFSLCSFVYIAHCDNYLSLCSVNKPFLLFDSTCGSFEDVCVKKGDPSCDNLRNACQQCPSTNYSIPMILDALRMMKTAIYENRRNQTDDGIQTIKNLNIFLIVIVIIILILMILMILMPNITKGIRGRKKRRNKGDLEITTTENQITPLLENRKIEIKDINESQQSDTIEQWKDNLENLAMQIKNWLDELKSEIINVNTNFKRLDIVESMEKSLNDQFNKIVSDILSLRSKIESTEMKKAWSIIDLKETNENHDFDSLASSSHVGVNPISESQQIGDDITSTPP